MRLFLNPVQKAYLRELADEFNASASQIRDELNQLVDAGFLINKKQGRQIDYMANISHPLYPELHSMVRKALGMDRIVDSIIERLGNLKKAILLDDYAVGKDTGLVDLLLVGNINRRNLDDLVSKTEKYIGRKIRTMVLQEDEYIRMQGVFRSRPQLTLWDAGKTGSA